MLLRLSLIALLLPLLASAKRPVRPPYLQIGDTVGVVTPAGRLRPDADTARVRERLESWGLHVKFAPHYAAQQTLYFSAPDSVRAADLQQFIDDPSVKAVISYKGGYGLVRLLPLLHLERLRRAPKWIVGFSDITMLHLALSKLGVESIHGPMPTTFVFNDSIPDLSADSLLLALMGRLEHIETPPHPFNQPGTARGTLSGGNLTLICSAMGTPEQPDPRSGMILLIEDVGEAVYRLDRMMQQLQRSGLLSKVRGIVVGHFTDMKQADTFGDPYQVIAAYTKPLNIPVVFGFPVGHELPNHPVYMGRRVELRVTDAGASLSMR